MINTPFDWKTVGDLKGIPVGGMLGAYYGDDFVEAEKTGKLMIDWVTTDKLNF